MAATNIDALWMMLQKQQMLLESVISTNRDIMIMVSAINDPKGFQKDRKEVDVSTLKKYEAFGSITMKPNMELKERKEVTGTTTMIYYVNRHGAKEGDYKSYYNIGGGMYESGSYKAGKLHGTCTQYGHSGEVVMKTEYRDGKKEGKHVQFYQSGQKKMEMDYRNDEIHGRYITWNAGGDVEEDYTFVNGKKIDDSKN